MDDFLVKAVDIAADELKLLEISKGVFVEPFVLELRQGTKEERNVACHVLDTVAVFLGEPGGVAFEPGVCLVLGNVRQDTRKSVDVPGSFLR